MSFVTSIIHQLVPLLVPLLLVAAFALAAPAVREGYGALRALRVRARSRAARAAIDALTVLAGTAVAAAAEEVRNLKDPTKPGTWTRAVGLSIRDRVIGEVMHLGRDVIAQLRGLGMLDAEDIEQLLERLVESQVERLRRIAPTLPGAELTVDDLAEVIPPALPAPSAPAGRPASLRGATIAAPVAPPADTSPPSSAQRGFARPLFLAALLFVLLLPLLIGCEHVREGVMRVAPGVPSPSECVPDSQRCNGTVPEVCADSNLDFTRWWPSLPRRADGTQRVCSAGCLVTDAGVATCAPAIPANPFTTDASVTAEGGAL